MTKTEISKIFSMGEFEKVYDLISDDAEWIVIEENHFKGKEKIISNCEQVSQYFKSVKTDFKINDIIESQFKVVITGTAEFKREDKRVAFVSSCDIYEFNNSGKINRIISYCIQAK